MADKEDRPARGFQRLGPDLWPPLPLLQAPLGWKRLPAGLFTLSQLQTIPPAAGPEACLTPATRQSYAQTASLLHLWQDIHGAPPGRAMTPPGCRLGSQSQRMVGEEEIRLPRETQTTLLSL